METTKQIFLNRWFLGMLALGGLGAAFPLIAEGAGLKPCMMCKLQRIPFILLLLNAGFGLLTSCKQGFFKVTQVCISIGAALGLTHFLMQMGALPDFCTSYRGFSTTQEFSALLTSPKCSDMSWSILGVPVSLINGLSHVLFLGVSAFFNLKHVRGS